MCDEENQFSVRKGNVFAAKCDTAHVKCVKHLKDLQGT